MTDTSNGMTSGSSINTTVTVTGLPFIPSDSHEPAVPTVNEVGKRNAGADAKAMNAAIRMLIDLMDDKDIEEETIQKMNAKIMKPVVGAEAAATKTDDQVVESWAPLAGETVTEVFSAPLAEAKID